ncbi:MAG TPA: DUF126 domain-containing protein [Stellaceae bacterium]|jgi:hypothetical protein|nr:DUF126 domain-containing protein [Stellaceae bacterium]
MPRIVSARGIVTGRAEGPALVASEPVSFLGDVDIRSGRIVGALPSARNASVKGTVLVFPYTSGSAGAWRFLFQLYKHGNHPVALVTETVPDPSVVQGAILAGIPIVCAPAEPLQVTNGTILRVEAEGERGLILVLD